MQTNLQRQGTVKAHPKGFGFVEDLESGESWFIPAYLMRRLLTGDRVAYEISRSGHSVMPSVSACTLVERPESYWLGELRQGQVLSFRPDEPSACSMVIRNGNNVGSPGDVLQVRVAAGTPDRDVIPVDVVANLGPRNDRGFDTQYAKARYRLPSTWSEQALSEATEAATQPISPTAEVADLRGLAFVTIDSESTKDIDDAVFARLADDGGVHLYVAIADVSRYVRQGSELDRQARERATSVYFADEVLPMLPGVLSNGVCSLNPGVDRYAVVIEASVAKTGQVTFGRAYRAVIRSRAKLSYNEVSAFIEGQPLKQGIDAQSELDAVQSSLHAMHGLHAQNKALRELRGLAEQRDLEPSLVLEEDGAYGLKWSSPTLAHEMVEECMLLANQAAAAQLLASGSGAGMFRHHKGVNPEKWEANKQWFDEHGLSAPQEPTLPGMRELLATAGQEGPLAPSVLWRLRRSMATAEYTADPRRASHFSLGFERYTHFTSPIRRYADLTVHRLLLGESVEGLEELAQHCTLAARRADLATRDVMDRIKKRVLVRQAMRQSMSGQVVSSSRHGLRVSVDAWGTSVLVPGGSCKRAGFSWNPLLEAWHQGNAVLGLGCTAQVRPFSVEDERNLLEIHAELLWAEPYPAATAPELAQAA